MSNNAEGPKKIIPRSFLDWAEEVSLKEFLKWEIDSIRDKGIWLKAAKLMAIAAYRKLTETKAQETEKPGHIHVQLPSGAIANVSPDASPELLSALNKMAELAQANVPDTSVGEIDECRGEIEFLDRQNNTLRAQLAAKEKEIQDYRDHLRPGISTSDRLKVLKKYSSNP